MTDTTRQQTRARTRPTDEIEPMVPRLPREYRTDGGSRRLRADPRRERPPATDYTEPEDRHREEIEPMVPRLD
jgi:hypothetical protein